MALVEIDVVDPEPLQRGVELLADLGARQAAVAAAHREIGLGRQHVGIARPPGQDLAEEALGGAAAIDVGGVDEVDAELEGAIDAGRGLCAIDADAVGQP